MISWHQKAKEALKAKGIRYIDLAATLNCTESPVGHWLNGRREPDVETLRIIAREAGLSLSEMVGDDPRFVGDKAEKQLIDAFRSLTESQKNNILALITHLK